MDVQYKSEHELFVLSDGGGSALVVAVCIMHAPVLVTICKICNTLVSADSTLSIILEFLIVIYPLLLIVTVLSKFIIESFAVLTVLLIVLYFVFVYNSKNSASRKSDINQTTDLLQPNRKYFISVFKGINVLLTIISILAVDFKVFPRSFAKTEGYGIGLMDVGVATFIISSALTSRAARGIDAKTRNSVNNEVFTSVKSTDHWTKCVLPFLSIQKLAVLLLGLMRLVILKVSNYHEHITEYGVHWNFFVTLFLIWTVTDVCNFIVPPNVLVALAVLLLCVYQYMLLTCGLGYYILSDERTDFISANKEGIFSLLGCIPLYIITQQLSKGLFFHASPNENKTNSPPRKGETKIRQKLIANMVMCSLTLWILWGVTNTFVEEMSRRLMNIAFVTFTLAISFSVLSFLAISEDIFEMTVTGSVITLECMNTYQLQIFLFANALTGVINMAIKTIYVNNTYAVLLLALYCFVVIYPFYLHKTLTTKGS